MSHLFMAGSHRTAFSSCSLYVPINFICTHIQLNRCGIIAWLPSSLIAELQKACNLLLYWDNRCWFLLWMFAACVGYGRRMIDLALLENFLFYSKEISRRRFSKYLYRFLNISINWNIYYVKKKNGNITFTVDFNCIYSSCDLQEWTTFYLIV